MKKIMKSCKLFILLGLYCFFISCSADINPSKCEINVKQGNTDIPCETGYFDFGNIPLGFSQSITFTIENIGIDVLKLTGNPAIDVKGQNATEFIADLTKTATKIQSSKSTTFSINFLPSSLGQKNATISISNDDRDENPFTFAIVGIATAPAPEIHIKQSAADILCSTGSYDFGSIILNKMSTKIEFTIENNGNEVLTLNGNPDIISLTGTNADMFEIDQTSILSQIVSGSSTTFYITFKPTSAGIKTAKISILNNDSDENPYTFTITGTGVASPEINVKQGFVDLINGSGKYVFSDTLINESSSEVIFTIENLGTATLHLTNSSNFIEIEGADAAMFSINLTSTDEFIAPGNSTTFGVTFTPTNAGSKTATISIANNDFDENPYTFTIEGTGVTSDINIKQASTNIPSSTGIFDFGLVAIGGSSAEITFTIENLGSGNLKLSGSPKIEKTGSDSAMFSISETSTVSPVISGHTTTFTIKFLPTAGGNKSATISIPNNDPDENPYTFTITGEGENGAAIGWIGGGSNGWKTGTAPSSGTDYQSFNVKYGLCLDSNGNIYVADSKNNRVCKWDKDGNAIGWIGGGSNGWKTTTTSSSGSDYQSFNWPMYVVVDSAGYIYVSDSKNNRICKWDKNGNAIGWIGGGSNGWKTTTAPSSYGADYQSLYHPIGVFVDSSGSLYISDRSNSRICKWDKNGNAIGWIGGGSNGWKTTTAISVYASDYQSFMFPEGITLDSFGNIFVADCANDRISKWDSAGNAIGWIGGGSNGWKTGTAPSYDSDYQSFNSPSDVALDSLGYILVADSANNRISKWNSAGNAIGWIGGGSNGWKTHSHPFSGSDYQSFQGIVGVRIDTSGNIFVSDISNYRICKWHD